MLEHRTLVTLFANDKKMGTVAFRYGLPVHTMHAAEIVFQRMEKFLVVAQVQGVQRASYSDYFKNYQRVMEETLNALTINYRGDFSKLCQDVNYEYSGHLDFTYIINKKEHSTEFCAIRNHQTKVLNDYQSLAQLEDKFGNGGDLHGLQPIRNIKMLGGLYA
jgi:hypothetical protein